MVHYRLPINGAPNRMRSVLVCGNAIEEATQTDPYFSDVIVLANFEAPDNSSTFTDIKGNSFSAGGSGARIKTDQKKFGNASWYFDGANDRVTTGTISSLSLASQDFTVEFWLRLASFVAGSKTFATNATTTSTGWAIGATNTNRFLAAGVTGNGFEITGSTALVINNWHHAALTRESGVFRLFLDGILQGSFSGTSNVSGNRLLMGEDVSAGNDFNGWIDEVRITNNICRYNANFTPPISAFPVS